MKKQLKRWGEIATPLDDMPVSTQAYLVYLIAGVAGIASAATLIFMNEPSVAQAVIGTPVLLGSTIITRRSYMKIRSAWNDFKKSRRACSTNPGCHVTVDPEACFMVVQHQHEANP